MNRWISFVVALAAVSTASAAAPPATRPSLPGEPPLRNKTLVAWVSPANLTQRGGGVLTIDDQRGRFDAIVFAELAPAKWMAGSDFFRRTQKNQSTYPVETAGSSFVQVAIVYQDRLVTVYRDGQLYARHTMSVPPQEFGPDAMVFMGKRHQAQNDNARFAGAIDDARVYDRALSGEQIAALKPNVASDPKPWAWWTFDDAQATERTGRFVETQLLGGARVLDGKLLLDGAAATLVGSTGVHVPFEPETPAMPANPPATWLTYHLAHPGPGAAYPGDPNCAFFWKGRYHLHYIYKNDSGFAFAHVSSDDLLHWKWHPTTLTPPVTGHGMFSGTGFFTRDGKPAIIYHGQGSGRNQVAIALDDQLEKWTHPIAVEPRVRPDQDGSKIANWDPDAWLDGDTYYALSGGNPGSGKPPTLMKSPDLKTWDYLGLFMPQDMPDVQKDEDVSCPNFFKIGNKHMLLCISHNKGCRYYLGQWKDEKFTPDFHVRMNWNQRDFFAPESVLTPDGRRIMWAWCVLNDPKLQTGIQSLPRELSLPPDGVLRIKPTREIDTLRYAETIEPDVTVNANTQYTLKNIAGDTLELKLTLKPAASSPFGLRVFCDKEGNNGFPITLDLQAKTLALGTIKAPFEAPSGEKIELRIFLDKSMIEVFANDRQAAVAAYPHRAENQVITLFSQAAGLQASGIQAWKMKSVYAPAIGGKAN